MAQDIPVGQPVSPSALSKVHPSTGPCARWLLLEGRKVREQSLNRNSNVKEMKVRGLPESAEIVSPSCNWKSKISAKLG